MYARISLTLICLLAVSCTGLQDAAWTGISTPKTYFEAAYSADPVNQRFQSESEYLEWIVSFYEGSLLYPAGWQDVEETILALTHSGAPAAATAIEFNEGSTEHAGHAEQLNELGAAIAAEWAKHNAIRLIDNRLLSLWGSMLQLAPDSLQLARTLDAVSADVHAILARRLDPGDVNPRRYEELLEIQLFDDF